MAETPPQPPAANEARRPIPVRGHPWSRATAGALARAGISPNAISLLSVVFAALGASALLWLPLPWGAWLAALAVVLRLLCNMFDGMVAVEHGRQTATGMLYNEVPDRIADSLFLVALGVAAGMAWLGWCAALLAALTAYVRVLGGAQGLAQDFRGPMAKPQRMWLLVLACVLAPLAPALGLTALHVLQAALWLIALGSALTCITRLRAIAAALHARG